MIGTLVTVEQQGGAKIVGIVVEEHEDYILVDVGFSLQYCYRKTIVSITPEGSE